MGSFNQRFALLALSCATLTGSALTTKHAEADICEHPATQDMSGKCVCPGGMTLKGSTCVTSNVCPPGTKLVSGKCQSTCPADKTLFEGKCIDKVDVLPADAGKTVLIAAGSYMAGATPDNTLGRADPVHKVSLSTYSIDKYEVSVEEYDKCVKAGICPKPGGVQTGCNYGNSKRRAHPMNCVTWNESQTYCDWRGMRLPTEAEWEYAARGKNSNLYPWGDAAPSCKNTAMTHSSADGKGSCGGNTSAIGGHPDGKSPFGVHDLAGNVEEWMWDEYGYYKATVTEMTDPGGPINGTDHVVKGGAYDLSGSKIFAPARRISAAPENRYVWLGFRCAKGPAPKATPQFFTEVPPPPPPPVIEKPKSPMISIPGGSFTMGRDGDPFGSPAHAVTLSPYMLDTYEVTVSDYLKCMDDKKCTIPYYDPKQSCNYDLTSHGLHPINCVKYKDAETFCAWMGKRLPTEAEWEFAARGPAGRTYPWGNAEPSCAVTTFMGPSGAGCVVENGKAVTSALGQFPAGVGYFGNFDLAGNVAEFVSDYFAPYQAVAVTDPKGAPSGSQRVLRGGSFKTAVVNAVSRQLVDDNWFADTGGFRCAKSM